MDDIVDPIATDAAYNWVYYLCGSIFLVCAIAVLFYTYKIRNTRKEYESIAISFGYWKKLWYKHRYHFMILVTVVLFVIAITFFLLPESFTSSV